jgi:hypothetical protein
MSGIPHWAVPGAKVVCVDFGTANYGGKVVKLKAKTLYTIERTVEPFFDQWGIILVEVKSDGNLGGYMGYRFRPSKSLLTPSLDELADLRDRKFEEVDRLLERLADNPIGLVA